MSDQLTKELLKTRPDALAKAITMREYFAAQALAGFCANGGLALHQIELARAGKPTAGFAEMAVRTADALIFQLNKEVVKNEQAKP